MPESARRDHRGMPYMSWVFLEHDLCDDSPSCPPAHTRVMPTPVAATSLPRQARDTGVQSEVGTTIGGDTSASTRCRAVGRGLPRSCSRPTSSRNRWSNQRLPHLGWQPTRWLRSDAAPLLLGRSVGASNDDSARQDEERSYARRSS